MVSVQILGGRYKNIKAKWDPMNEAIVFSKPRKEYESNESYANTILSNIEAFFGENFKIIECLFENAPTNINDAVFQSNTKPFDEKDINGFLSTKNIDVVQIYNSIVNVIKIKNNLLKIVAKPNYIALKNENDKNICEFHFLKDRLQITTKEPVNNELKIGKKLPDNYLWSLNYQIDVYPNEDKLNVIDAILDVWEQLK